MEIDYSPFLHTLEDGRILWRLDDAIKLGAGYFPVRDDKRNLTPVLRANSNQVQANQGELLSQFNLDRYTDDHPRLTKQDGEIYVEAREFLRWLSQYISLTQSAIPFPNDLVRAIRNLPDPPRISKPAKFESLTTALEGWFDKPMDNLPDEQRHRVETDFFPMPWDRLSADQRRSMAAQWDYHHDPATEGHRQYWWDFHMDMEDLENQIAKWEAVATPTATDLEKKENRLAELKQKLAEMERQGQKSANRDTKHPGHLNHDMKWQERANEIAAEIKRTTGKTPTKNAVAKKLAPELGETVETVERRIRVKWKAKRSSSKSPKKIA
jgi:hypothetical protein